MRPITLISWDAAAGAVSYAAQAVTDQGLTSVCLGSDTKCTLPRLQPDQTYNVTVTAINHMCNTTSDPLILTIGQSRDRAQGWGCIERKWVEKLIG